VVALGIGANTENLPVGLAYGLRRRRIGLGRNLFIAAATTAATLVPLTIGQGLHGHIPSGASDAIAGLLLAGLGLFNVWAERRTPGKRVDTAVGVEGTVAPIGLRETLALAGALSLNNATLPFCVALAEKGWRKALAEDAHLRNGLNVHAGRITHAAVARDLGLEYLAPDQAIAA